MRDKPPRTRDRPQHGELVTLIAPIAPLVARAHTKHAEIVISVVMALSHSRSKLLSFGFGTAAALLALASAAAQEHAPFTDAERYALVSGELVRRDLSRNDLRRRMYGGASWQRVRAPIERVWRAAVDPGALTRLIPSLDRARLVEQHDQTRVLHMHHSYAIMETAYYIRMDLDAANHSLSFRVDRSRPGDIHDGRGYLRLSPYRGDTIVEWGMLVDIGDGAIATVFGPMLNQWLLLPPRCVRDEVEEGRVPTC